LDCLLAQQTASRTPAFVIGEMRDCPYRYKVTAAEEIRLSVERTSYSKSSAATHIDA
jgi:hypothetical protein